MVILDGWVFLVSEVPLISNPPLDDIQLTIAGRRIRLCHPRNGPNSGPGSYLTRSVFEVALQNSTPTQISQLIVLISNSKQ